MVLVAGMEIMPVLNYIDFTSQDIPGYHHCCVHNQSIAVTNPDPLHLLEDVSDLPSWLWGVVDRVVFIGIETYFRYGFSFIVCYTSASIAVCEFTAYPSHHRDLPYSTASEWSMNLWWEYACQWADIPRIPSLYLITQNTIPKFLSLVFTSVFHTHFSVSYLYVLAHAVPSAFTVFIPYQNFYIFWDPPQALHMLPRFPLEFCPYFSIDNLINIVGSHLHICLITLQDWKYQMGKN